MGKSSMAFGPYRKTNPQNCHTEFSPVPCDPFARQTLKRVLGEGSGHHGGHHGSLARALLNAALNPW